MPLRTSMSTQTSAVLIEINKYSNGLVWVCELQEAFSHESRFLIMHMANHQYLDQRLSMLKYLFQYCINVKYFPKAHGCLILLQPWMEHLSHTLHHYHGLQICDCGVDFL